jgi:hypothetical protein
MMMMMMMMIVRKSKIYVDSGVRSRLRWSAAGLCYVAQKATNFISIVRHNVFIVLICWCTSIIWLQLAAVSLLQRLQLHLCV